MRAAVFSAATTCSGARFVLKFRVLAGFTRLTSICAAAAVALGGLALGGAPLSHDEATYAVGGRLLVEGTGGYWPHRSVGMQPLAAIGVLLGGSDLALRMVAVVLSIALIAAMWWVVDRAYGRATATWTAALVAGSFVMVRRGFMVESDVPAAILTIACVALLASALGADRRRWSIVWCGPLAAAAYYVRYGSAPVLAAIALAAAIVWRDRLRVHAGPLVAAAAAFGACLIPHALHSIEVGGSVTWIAMTAKDIAGRTYVGDGLVYYATRWWLEIGFVSLVMLTGLLAVATRRIAVSRTTRFLALSAVFALLALGLTAHGEPRYGLVPQLLLTAVGVESIRSYRSWGRWHSRAAAVGVVVAWLIAAALAVNAVRRQTRAFRPRLLAGELIRTAGGPPCVVQATRTPQLAWYSGCRAAPAWEESPSHRYIVWFDLDLGEPTFVEYIRGFGERIRLIGQVGDRTSETAAVYYIR